MRGLLRVPLTLLLVGGVLAVMSGSAHASAARRAPQGVSSIWAAPRAVAPQPATPPPAATRPATTSPAPAASTAAAPAVAGGAPGDSFQLGLSAFLMWRDWDRVDNLLTKVAASRTPWLRVDTGWCSLMENGRNVISTWYQDRLDKVVAQASAKGIKLLVMVGCAPAWAGGTTYHDYPTKPADYRDAMAYLAKRYAGRVQAWEIWNEPDCIGGCGRGSAAEYVPVLKAGFQGVRAGDPSALVVTGGVSGNNTAWLRQMYAAGAKGYFDVLATHPYIDPTTSGPQQAAVNQYSIKAVTGVRQLMVAQGDSAKPIWFTEYGWTTQGTEKNHSGVTEAQQATYLTESVPVMKAYPYVTRAFWYAMRDRDDSTAYENGFGLLRLDGSAKPSWSAYTKAVAGLAG